MMPTLFYSFSFCCPCPVYSSVIITKLLLWHFWRSLVWSLPGFSIPRTEKSTLNYHSQSQGLIARAQYPQTEFSGGHSYIYKHVCSPSFSHLHTHTHSSYMLLPLEFPLIGWLNYYLAVLALTWPTKENFSSVPVVKVRLTSTCSTIP